MRGCSSVDRARPCQGRGHEFESRHPHQRKSPALRRAFSLVDAGGVYSNSLARMASLKTRKRVEVLLRALGEAHRKIVSSPESRKDPVLIGAILLLVRLRSLEPGFT